MARNTKTGQSADKWRFIVPGAAAPVGGGLLKIGEASTLVAVSVSLAPYVIMASLYALFVIGYIPAVICYLRADRNRQEAINQLITTSANAIVCLLTLTPPGPQRTPPRDA